MEFCQEITDSKVVSLLLADKTLCSPSPKPGERYFFFPGLVHLDAPQDLWQPDEDSSYHSGWLLQCKPQQSFSLRFLHVLIHRLAFQFAFAFTPSEPSSVNHLALHRKCCIWDKGISWVDSHGGEAIVEIAELKRLLVMTRCKREKLVSVQLRSAIIHHVLNTKQELCPKVVVHESFIFPDDVVCYPIDPTKVTAVSITDVAQTVKTDGGFVVHKIKQQVELEKLLHFEPYAMLGTEILKKLFDENSPEYDQLITNDLIKHINSKVYKRLDSYIELLKTSGTPVTPQGDTHHLVFQTWREYMGAKGTLGNLRKLLDKFSIFAGRNPLDLVAGMCLTYSLIVDQDEWPDLCICLHTMIVSILRYS